MISKKKWTNYFVLFLILFLFACVFLATNFFGNINNNEIVLPTDKLDKKAIYGSTLENENNKPIEKFENMVWIPGGEFSMGCSVTNESLCGIKGITNDANPIHSVYVDGFWMDTTEVTNKQFAAFIEATGYVTIAEIKPTTKEFPGIPDEQLFTGSLVFRPTKQEVLLNNYLQWWEFVGGANWRHPEGPGSSIKGKDNFPVVQVCFDDAIAYSKWAGKRLPTEAEWEFAARGGKSGNLYAWGNTLKINGKFQANIYEGNFPVSNGDSGEDGFVGIAPVAQYKANSYGLYDTAGNVWEWINDWYDVNYYQLVSKNKLTKNPKGPVTFNDPTEPGLPIRVQRGGSFLCTDQYCTRYMVGTRGKAEARSAANHIGFRCVK